MDTSNGLIVLLPYEEGQEFSGENVVYLPVYVATQDNDLALAAVAYEACVNYRYVTFSLADDTEEVWYHWNFPGTLREPGIELPNTEEAYQIPKLGERFCCASLERFKVLQPEAMVQRLRAAPEDFMLQTMINSEDKNDPLRQAFEQWIEKYFGEVSLSEEREAGLSVLEMIGLVKAEMGRVHDLLESVLLRLREY